LASLARAAVSGDESALDMFAWQKGKGNSKVSAALGPQESLTFFLGGRHGIASIVFVFKYCLMFENVKYF
jgi:intraflagellar transport protein 140